MYRTQRRAYFLAGEGGSLSRWAKSTPHGTIPGEGIEPLSKDDARAYAKDAGLSSDRFARADGHWQFDGQTIQGDHVIRRTI